MRESGISNRRRIDAVRQQDGGILRDIKSNSEGKVNDKLATAKTDCDG